MPQKTSKKLKQSDADVEGSWARALSEALATKALEPKGEGWRTIYEIQSAQGWGIVKTRSIVSGMIAAGKMDAFKGNGTNAGGGARASSLVST